MYIYTPTGDRVDATPILEPTVIRTSSGYIKVHAGYWHVTVNGGFFDTPSDLVFSRDYVLEETEEEE